MNTAVIGVIALLFVLLLNAMPVSFALLITGGIGLYLVSDLDALIGILKLTPYEQVAGYTLSTLPMFVLVGEFLTAGRFTHDLFVASERWLGHVRAGMGYAAVAAGVMLAAISGSSSAAAAALATSIYPEMRRYGYNDSFATGAIAVIGTLAIMIPPSIGLILFGVITETSVGKLLIAGLIPGLITAVGYSITIYWMVHHNPDIAPNVIKAPPWRERFTALKTVWPILLLMIGIIVGIYSGAITPTEVAAISAILVLFLAVVMRRMGWRELNHALLSATRISSMILTIIACSAVFGAFLTMSGSTQNLINSIQAANIPPYAVLFSILLMLIVLGCFLDQVAILVLTLPLIFPLLMRLGFDPIWMGVIYVKTCEIGFITPPFGLNAFVVSGATGIPVTTVFRGVWPFLIAELVLMSILIAFPGIFLWMPNRL